MTARRHKTVRFLQVEIRRVHQVKHKNNIQFHSTTNSNSHYCNPNMTTTAAMSSNYDYDSNPSNPNPSAPSDPSNFSTTLSPPGSPHPRPRNPSTPSTPSSTSPSSSSTSNLILPLITNALLQTALSLKRDFRFLKLTTTTASASASHPSFSSSFDIGIGIDNSEGIHKLLQTSLHRLNSSTRTFVRDANSLLDEEVNRSFDAYLHGRLPLHRDGHIGNAEDSDSGYASPLSSDGDDDIGQIDLDGAMMTMMSLEEKETRGKLKRLVGVVEELRGVFFRKVGKYVLVKGGERGGKGLKEGGDGDEGVGKGVEDLVVGRLFGDEDAEGDEEEGKGRREHEDVKVGLERLAGRLGMRKRMQ